MTDALFHLEMSWQLVTRYFADREFQPRPISSAARVRCCSRIGTWKPTRLTRPNSPGITIRSGTNSDGACASDNTSDRDQPGVRNQELTSLLPANAGANSMPVTPRCDSG